MSSYIVRSPIKSGGKIHSVGDTIALDDEIAAPLLAAGRIDAVVVENSSEGGRSDVSGDGAQQAPDPKASKIESAPAAPVKKSGRGK